MKIVQCHISPGVKFFGDNFKKKWNLVDYYDRNLPCVFLGCYKVEDIDIVKKHVGFKVILFTGSDANNVLKFSKEDRINIISDTLVCWDGFKNLNNFSSSKFLMLPLKDYSKFTSTPLGDKIYAYQGRLTKSFQAHYRKDLVDELIKHFGKDRVILGYQGNSIDFVEENYYKKSFINIQFNSRAGLVTVLEMAHMGRRSISNYPAPFCIKFKTIEDVIKSIEEESKRIGYLQSEVSEAAKKFMFVGDSWLDTKFWES